MNKISKFIIAAMLGMNYAASGYAEESKVEDAVSITVLPIDAKSLPIGKQFYTDLFPYRKKPVDAMNDLHKFVNFEVIVGLANPPITLQILPEGCKYNDACRMTSYYRVIPCSKAVKKLHKKAQNIVCVVEYEPSDANKVRAGESSDYPSNYHDYFEDMSIKDFQLDAKSLPTGKQLAVEGFYEKEGGREFILEMPSFVPAPNKFRLYLLTDEASRETRKKLLDNCGYGTCRVKIFGHVQPCIETMLGKSVRENVCLVVDDIDATRKTN